MLVDLRKMLVLLIIAPDIVDVCVSIREALSCVSANIDSSILERELVSEEVKEADEDLVCRHGCKVFLRTRVERTVKVVFDDASPSALLRLHELLILSCVLQARKLPL